MIKEAFYLLSAGIMGIGSFFNYSKADSISESYVFQKNNSPVALSLSASNQKPNSSVSSPYWQVYDSGDIIGIYLGPKKEEVGKKIVLAKDGNNPDVYENSLVFEKENKVYFSDLSKLDPNTFTSVGTNLYETTSLESICLTDGLADSSGNELYASNPKINKDKVVYRAGKIQNNALYWDHIYMHDLTSKTSLPISNSLSFKDSPYIDYPLVVYSQRGSSWSDWEVIGYEILTAKEFLLDNEAFSYKREPVTYNDKDKGQYIIAYSKEDLWEGDRKGIGIKRVKINGDVISVDPQENPYNLPTFYDTKTSCSSLSLFGASSDPNNSQVGPFLAYIDDEGISYGYNCVKGIDLKNSSNFVVSNDVSIKSSVRGFVKEGNRQPYINYSTNDFTTPKLNLTFYMSSSLGSIIPTNTQKKYSALLSAKIQGKPLGKDCNELGIYIPGDVNHDCYVNLADAEVIADNWLKQCTLENNKCDYADINLDKIVNNLDWEIYKENLGKSNNPLDPNFREISLPSTPLNLDVSCQMYYSWWENEFDWYLYDQYLYDYWNGYSDREPIYPTRNLKTFAYAIQDKTIGGASIEKIQVPAKNISGTYPDWDYGYYYNYYGFDWSSEIEQDKVTYTPSTFDPFYYSTYYEGTSYFYLQTYAKKWQYKNIKIYTKDRGIIEKSVPVPVENSLGMSDLNYDGIVDEQDFLKIGFNWLGYGDGDVTGDYFVNFSDFLKVSQNLGKKEPWYGETCYE